MFTRCKIPLFALLVAAAAPISAKASIIGDTIAASSLDGSTAWGGTGFTPSQFTVTAGTDSVYNIGTYQFDLSFTANSLSLTQTTGNRYNTGAYSAFNIGDDSVSFIGPVFDIVSGNPFAAVSSVSAPTSTGITAASVTDTGSELMLNLNNTSFGGHDAITVNFVPSVSPAPLPGSVGMFGGALVGLIGLAGLRRKSDRPEMA